MQLVAARFPVSHVHYPHSQLKQEVENSEKESWALLEKLISPIPRGGRRIHSSAFLSRQKRRPSGY